MSFSSVVKEELESRIDLAKHCQIAEFAAIMALCGKAAYDGSGEPFLVMETENEAVARKFAVLAEKAFQAQPREAPGGHEGRRGSDICLQITGQAKVMRILMALKWQDDEHGPIKKVFAHPLIVQKECCKRAFIRGAFLAAGSISDPQKFYHYEVVCDSEDDAKRLSEIIEFFHLEAKVIARKKNFIVYIKEGSHITDCLNVMGAVVSQMELYNVMILKGVRNDLNRKVNCETANLNKTVEAGVKQMRDIEYIRDTVGLSYLKDPLYEVAVIRLENVDMNLKDIGELLSPKVGKSGVNHRLRRISEIAQELRRKNGVPEPGQNKTDI